MFIGIGKQNMQMVILESEIVGQLWICCFYSFELQKLTKN